MSRDRASWDWDDAEEYQEPPPPNQGRRYQDRAQKIADFYASRSPDYQQYNRNVRGLEMDKRVQDRMDGIEDLPPPPTRPQGDWVRPQVEMYRPSQEAPLKAKILFPSPPGDHGDARSEDASDPDMVNIKAVKDILGMMEEDQDAGSDISLAGGQPAPLPPQPVFPSLGRPKVKSIFALQVFSTLALVTIYVLNCYLNIRFFDTLANFDELLQALSNPILLGILGLIVSFIFLLFSQFNPKIRRRIILVVCFSIIGVLVLPPLVAVFQGGWMTALWQLISVGLILLKVLLLFLLWAPLILGVLGVWLKNRTSIYMSAILMLSVVIILDVILLVLSEPVQKQLWGASLLAFALGLFLFFELGESAIRFEQLYNESVLVDKRTVQSRHIIRLSKRYFIFTVVFLFVALFCTLLIYNSDVLFINFMPEKTSKSLIMDTVYGSLFSMGLMIFLLIVVGSTLKNWNDLKGWWSEKASLAVGKANSYMRERAGQREAREEEVGPIPARHAIKKRPARRSDGGEGRGYRMGGSIGRGSVKDRGQGGRSVGGTTKRPRPHHVKNTRRRD